MQIEQAAVVPIVIVVTQVLKPIIKKDSVGGIIALMAALLGTAMVNFYGMTESAFDQMGTYQLIRFFVECFFTAVATWLAASKIYDFILGDKKWDKEVAVQLEENYLKGVSEGKTASCDGVDPVAKPST